MVITINGVKTLQIRNAKNGDFVLNLASVELVSISAVYTQSGTVYADDSLDTLKSDLVVTARYDDNTSQTVTDYELSGSLTAGTSTITVTYGGKTTTFNVQVSASDILYRLSQPTTFDGTSDYIDTGIQLMSDTNNYTIVLTAEYTRSGYQSAVIHCMHEVRPWPGIALQTSGNLAENTKLFMAVNGSTQKETTFIRPLPVGTKQALVIRIVKDSGQLHAVLDSRLNDAEATQIVTGLTDYVPVTETLLIGAYRDANGNLGRYWQGTMTDFKVYEGIMSDEDVEAYLQEAF